MKLYAGGQDVTLPKTLTLKGDGVESILFDPFEVPAGDVVQLTLEAQAGDAADKLVTEVPIRPWGVQAFATASGTANDDTTVFVGLPAGRPYESPEMIVVVSPTLRRMIVELALGQSYFILDRRTASCILPPTFGTTADRASDLLASASALKYVREVGGAKAPEASRLAENIRGSGGGAGHVAERRRRLALGGSRTGEERAERSAHLRPSHLGAPAGVRAGAPERAADARQGRRTT